MNNKAQLDYGGLLIILLIVIILIAVLWRVFIIEPKIKYEYYEKPNSFCANYIMSYTYDNQGNDFCYSVINDTMYKKEIQYVNNRYYFKNEKE